MTLLDASEEVARKLLDHAPDPMLVVDAHGVIQSINKQGEKLFGYASEELVGKALDVLLPDRYRSAHAHHVNAFRAEPSRRSLGDRSGLRALRRDGTELCVDVSLSPVTTPNGLVIVAAVHDVSDRVSTEQARATAQREAEQARGQLTALLENIPDLVISTDAHGVIQFINRLLPPHTREQVVGASILAFVPIEQRSVLSSALERVCATGEPTTYEVSTTAADGSILWFASHMGAVRLGDETVGAVVISRDITEQKRTEAQLISSDRMAAVGMLAAGVAHEINNPLAAIVANLDLALREVADLGARNVPCQELLDELRDSRDSAERIRLIVRDLRVFSRSETARTEPVDPKQIFESTLRMAWNEIRHRARLVRNYGDVPAVEANESRLGQVLLNLVVNAAQSIPEGNSDSNEIRVSTRVDAVGHVVFEVADTGSGITPEILRHIFEPFVTTKPAGLGTGLGLAICHRIVVEHNGKIEVESELGKGSVFRVTIPPARPSATSEETVRATVVSRVAQRRGRVLVVDDEPMIGTVIRQHLSTQHEVITTTSARDALQRLAAGERFDVILCDVMMPDVTGVELYEEIERTLPEQLERVIFLTGGAFTVRTREFLENVGNVRIEKPFDPAQLRALINDRIR